MGPPPQRRWFLYWLVAFGVLAFGVPEAIAVISPESGDTLSESVRWLVGSPLGSVLFVGFMAWFLIHILSVWWEDRPDDPDRE